jgi:methylaspartate mutase sigma subunit
VSLNENHNCSTIVTGVIGEDVHVTGIRILEHALRKAGFKIVSLGIHNSQEDFINAAIETNADVIMISSLCGHAKLLVDGLRDKCIESGLPNIRLYLGGQLVIHSAEWEDIETTFREMGFDRVYRPFVLPKTVIADLKEDLGFGKDN